ncbi:MAG: hypothetical protein ACOCUH_02835 [Bacteriovoracia bacterium]
MKKFVLLFLLIAPAIALAHVPRYVMNDNLSIHNPFEIKNPTLSQVFYGDLQGTADYFNFSLDKEAEIKIGLLAPINESSFPKAELIAQIGTVQKLSGNFNEIYFEKFGSDYYRKGPEQTFTLSRDNYLIKVDNASSSGRYALVIGVDERFSLIETVRTIFILPIIKQSFFDKPIFEIFGGILGIFLILLTLAYSRKASSFRSKKVYWLGFIITAIAYLILLSYNPFNILGLLGVMLLIASGIAGFLYFYRSVNKIYLFYLQSIIWIIILLLLLSAY